MHYGHTLRRSSAKVNIFRRTRTFTNIVAGRSGEHGEHIPFKDVRRFAVRFAPARSVFVARKRAFRRKEAAVVMMFMARPSTRVPSRAPTRCHRAWGCPAACRERFGLDRAS